MMRGTPTRRPRTAFLHPRLWVGLGLAALAPCTAVASAQTSAAHAHGHPRTVGHEHGPAVVAVPVGPDAPPALFSGLGDHSMARVSRAEEAQAYFDQGLMLAYAFNHPEAAVSFARAAELDPTCALCSWGEAMVLGPNINASMDPADAPRAWTASREALRRLGPSSSDLERDLVRALAARYAETAPADRSPLDEAWADSMRAVALRHPDVPDVQAILADALMTTMPWDYWLPDGTPRPATREVQAALEAALEKDVRHPLANHLWIHLWEKHDPERAIPAARRLERLAPGAGHLVHMPGHVYIRTGRYADAVLANQRAIVADQAYLAQSGTQGLYRVGYVPHNVHFLWAAATLAGRSRTALEAADRLAALVEEEQLRAPGMDIIVQDYWITPILARVRFGAWEEVLAWPEPDADLLYPRGILHYARAVALARLGRTDEARLEADAVRAIARDPAMEAFVLWETNPASRTLAIAAGVADGEIRAATGDVDGAVRALEEAAAREDALVYQEPEAWHHPVRQVLGQVLLDAERWAEAEAAFRADLAKYPSNGWSLWGLATALAAQGRSEEAGAAWAAYREAFRDADVTLAAARF